MGRNFLIFYINVVRVFHDFEGKVIDCSSSTDAKVIKVLINKESCIARHLASTGHCQGNNN